MKNNILFNLAKVVLVVGSCLLAGNVCLADSARYPVDLIHSPITSSVADRLKSIVANGTGQNANVFMIVGDSISAGGGGAPFLTQFEKPQLDETTRPWDFARDLTGYEELNEALDFFRTGVVPDAVSPYSRDSLVARVSMGAAWATTATGGGLSPLQQEINAINPQYAIIMFGTNDVGYSSLDLIVENLLKIADRCIEQGIVPIFKKGVSLYL